ncbi:MULTISPECIES: reverse transcriptase-like protein [Sporosarcina]|uniref:reverse transcriptase-like protein n=1 Tax=Sporosarcina TaxID=1569 RepID=UPI00129A7299|nr:MULTISPECIES: reverse transcriptase-like protein [Sporosarcina]GKV67251.1 ribonuclease H [Sporosarcina sp. NCCP-2331]GLB57607.1 ribonuclease H [Sporosarcina sp. NCCP-2378]
MLEVYIDGASAGNPGLSGIGIYIKGEGQDLRISEAIEPTNNHSAEFQALVRGLEEAVKFTDGMVSVRSDSNVVVQSMEKEFTKNEQYAPFLQQALKLAKHFDLFFIKWIPDSSNRTADSLARQAIQVQKKSKG